MTHKRRTTIGLAATLALSLSAGAQAAERLPRVHLDAPRGIPDEPKVAARMRVTEAGRGSRGYRGPVGIERRGEASQAHPKQPYALETRGADGEDRPVALLGLPRGSDWVLNAAYTDPTLIRDALAYRTARRLGRYASRTRHVELVLDGRYQGVYVLMEALELGRHRVRAPRGRDAALLELTSDGKLDRGDRVLRGPVTRRPVVIADHAGDRLSRSERRALQARLTRFERALYGPRSTDPAVGWRRHLDPEAAVDFVLLTELFRNQDGFESSTFLHGSARGPLVLGPLWDLDLSMGSATRPGIAAPVGWQLAGKPWAGRLYADRGFAADLAARWRALRAGGLHAQLVADLRVLSGALGDAPARNLRRWPALRRPLFPGLGAPAGPHSAQLAHLEGWLAARVAWLDGSFAAGGPHPGTAALK